MPQQPHELVARVQHKSSRAPVQRAERRLYEAVPLELLERLDAVEQVGFGHGAAGIGRRAVEGAPDGVAFRKQRRRQGHALRLTEAPAVDQQAGDARVRRQPRHGAPQFRHAVVFERAETAQKGDCLRDRGGRRRFGPGKAGHVLLAEAQQVQHRAGQVHTANLRFGLFRPGAVSHRAPQPDADTRLRAAGAAGTLIRRRPRDRRESQSVQSHTRVEDQGTRQARIDHAGHALDCYRRLGHVGRQNDLPARLRQQGRVLLLGRQVAVQRQHREGARRGPRFEVPRGLADLVHPGQKHKQIA